MLGILTIEANPKNESPCFLWMLKENLLGLGQNQIGFDKQNKFSVIYSFLKFFLELKICQQILKKKNNCCEGEIAIAQFFFRKNNLIRVCLFTFHISQYLCLLHI